MRLFYWTKDRPGELDFAWVWLPHWITFHGDVLDRVYQAAQKAIPKGLTVDQLTPAHFDELEKVAIDAMVDALPFVTGLRAYLEGLRSVDMDPKKAAQHQFTLREPAKKEDVQ